MSVEKAALRAEAKRLAESYSFSEAAAGNASIQRRLETVPELLGAKRLFAYVAVGRECATDGIIKFASERGCVIALPVTVGAGEMYFARFTGELVDGKFGIPAPTGEALVPGESDVVIVPALCCDERCYRLGHGGGYYDRALADCRAYKVGLCRDRLLFKKIPTEWNDIRLDAVITETRIIKRGP